MSRRVIGRRLAAALVPLCTAFATAFGQSTNTRVIRGVVTESGTHAPLAGAVVVLQDGTGVTFARTLSDGAGRYRLSAPTSSSVIRAIRIGFTPTTRALAAAFGDSAVIDLALERLPTILTAVRVIDQPACPADPNGAATFALWEQARAALLGTVVTREANPATIRMFTYDRTSSADGRQVTGRVRDSTFLSTHGVVSRRAASEYAALGYRDVDVERQIERYYAPDAEVLLDSAFARSHCFSFRDANTDHHDEVGLTFSPLPHANVRVDSLVDVSGTIWIRRASPMLRSIDFYFTNTNSGRGQSDTLAGGSLVYQDMPNGTTLVTRWNVHGPVRVHQTVRVGGRLLDVATPKITGMREAGGEIADARWADSATWTASGLAHINGHIVASDARPMSGVLVDVRGTTFQARTDTAGGFVLPPLVPGSYALDAVDVQFADFGLTPSASVPIVVQRAETKTVTLTLPSRQMLVDSLCAESGRSAPDTIQGTGLIVGEVREPDGRTPAGALVRALWQAPSGIGADPVRLQGLADSTGHFHICGVPVGVPVTMSATSGDLVSSDVGVVARDAGSIVSAVLSLTSPNDPSLPVYRRRSLVVENSASGMPIAGVEVVDAGMQRGLGSTAESGRVSLATLPEGTTLLRLRKPGFAQRLLAFEVSPRDTAPLVVQLHPVQQLATVMVTATSTASRTAVAAGFDARLAAHEGRFLTTQDLQHREGEPLSTALATLGMRQQSRGSQVILLGGHGRTVCPVTIFIDGHLFYSRAVSGGDPPDARSLNASDYGAVEYYADTDVAPVQFKMTGAGCGTLLLWTRN